MKKLVRLIGTVTLFFILGAGLADIGISLTGCAGPGHAVYVGEVSARGSVETAMALWSRQVKAGKTTIAQEQKVKAAYNKVRASFIALCDAGKLLSASSSTNATGAVEQGFAQLSTDYLQDKTDLFNL